MDLQKEREAFEKLPDINAILYNSEFGFNEDINQYYHPNHTEHRLNYAFLMGAWSAWQAAKAQASKQFENFIDQAIEDSACADERRSLQTLLEDFQESVNDN